MVVTASTMSVYNHQFDHRASKAKGAHVGGVCVGRRGPKLTRGRAPQNGGTPLFIAARSGCVAVVELLVAKGADMDAPTNVRKGRGGDVGRPKGV